MCVAAVAINAGERPVSTFKGRACSRFKKKKKEVVACQRWDSLTLKYLKATLLSFYNDYGNKVNVAIRYGNCSLVLKNFCWLT